MYVHTYIRIPELVKVVRLTYELSKFLIMICVYSLCSPQIWSLNFVKSNTFITEIVQSTLLT